MTDGGFQMGIKQAIDKAKKKALNEAMFNDYGDSMMFIVAEPDQWHFYRISTTLTTLENLCE